VIFLTFEHMREARAARRENSRRGVATGPERA
jgi:hypothetical protein